MKKKILLLPNLFPEDEKDFKGIFVNDYIKVLQKNFIVEVFDTKLVSNKKGLRKLKLFDLEFYRYSLLENKKEGEIFLKRFYYIIWYFKTMKYLKKLYNDIDLVYAHDSVLHGLIAMNFAKSKRIPFIINEHTGPFSKITDNVIFRYISKKVIKESNALLTVSGDLLKQIKDSDFKIKQAFVIYNPIDTELFRLKENNKLNKNFCFIGRLEEYKGAFRVLKAFNKIFKKYEDWTLTIIGSGSEKNKIIQYLNRHSELSKRVLIKESMPKKELVKEFHKSDFFIFPSEHETFGLVVAEAMSCGLPVITSNVTSFPEFVNKDCGILINPTNIDEIANAIEEMIKNHNKYDRVAIRNYVIKNFGFDSFAVKLKNIIDRIIE